MLTLETTAQFRKDYKRMKKQGADLSKLQAILDLLLSETSLPAKNRDHALTGNYVGFRECHVSPDWLLIYRVERNELILTAARTGSHAELFSK